MSARWGRAFALAHAWMRASRLSSRGLVRVWWSLLLLSYRYASLPPRHSTGQPARGNAAPILHFRRAHFGNGARAGNAHYALIARRAHTRHRVRLQRMASRLAAGCTAWSRMVGAHTQAAAAREQLQRLLQ
jgi:hypothetical protein